MIKKFSSVLLSLVATLGIGGCPTPDRYDGPDDNYSSGTSSGAVGSCYGNPEQLGTEFLSEANVSRDPCEFPMANEISYCQQADAQEFATIPTTSAYDPLLNTLRDDAGISAVAPIRAVVDLQSVIPFGGGVTGHDIVLIDGKFIDILLELSQYLGMAELGETSDDLTTALNTIVAYHNAYAGVSAPPGNYVAASPEAMQAATKHLAALAGAILYHEFGHYWAWVCIDGTRVSSQPGFGLNYWPTKFEDDADLIAGVLSAKAGHSATDATMMIDVMAFYTLHRQGYVQSFSAVEAAYTQYMQNSPNYSSLAVRKQTIMRGYQDWDAYGSP